MTLSLDWEKDVGNLPSSVSIACPNCSKSASFVPAELTVKPKGSHGKPRERDSLVVKSEVPRRNYSNWHREHVLSYIGFGGAVMHRNRNFYPVSLYRHQLNSLLGTSICDHCHAPKKMKISWPQDAFYQTSYSGRMLWFYNREHAVAMLELLSGGSPENPWRFWFNRKLPTVFKTARARRQLPTKLKRMLRA